MAAERLAEFSRLESTFGAEPTPGAMLRIFRDIRGKTYTYAAIRADNGAWYLTGRDGNRARTWDDILELLSDWTISHYEVIPSPASQILPASATYPCGHTAAEHAEMFAPGSRPFDLAALIAKAESTGATASPLSFLEFLRSNGADAWVSRVPSLDDLFGGLRPGATPDRSSGTDGDDGYDDEGSHVDDTEPDYSPVDPDAQ
jgi:hypothetical protein